MAQLKKMYNGIYFKGKIYRNGDLTEKDALYLLKNHPAGEKLFEKLPVDKKPVKSRAKSKKVTKIDNDYGDSPNPDHEEK